MSAYIFPFPRPWLQAFTVEELERLAIMTVDGGLTDQEALKASGLLKKLWMSRAPQEETHAHSLDKA